jgi:CRISPR-associated exonuclease Cas4
VDPLPLSLLNDYLYCPRRAALKVVEGWREANAHTERGDIVHEHADLAGYAVVKGVTLLRALPVFSERLGLSGKCDIVEVEFGSAGDPPASLGDSPSDTTAKTNSPNRALVAETKVFGESPNTAREARALPAITKLRPVEFKLGKRRQWENDDVQLCAQALCLEEMFGVTIPRGAIFHAQSKRRREVEFSADLRARTEQAVTDLRALLPQSEISDLSFEIPKLPPARYIEGRCEECSLFEICLPKATCGDNRAERLARQLFQI